MDHPRETGEVKFLKPAKAPTDSDGKSSKSARHRPRRRGPKARRSDLKTKVVIRRLPPLLPEEKLKESLKQWVSPEDYDWWCFIPGKVAKSKAKESVFSRLYLHFKSLDAVIKLHRNYDGHLFIDSKGNEHRAVVEFAPYQKIPKPNQKVDVRQGTIDEDPDYLAFLESLKEDATDKEEGGESGQTWEDKFAASVTAQNLAAAESTLGKTTPLLEYLRAQKASQAAKKARAQVAKAQSKVQARLAKDRKAAQSSLPPTSAKQAGKEAALKQSNGGRDEPAGQLPLPGAQENLPRAPSKAKVPAATAEAPVGKARVPAHGKHQIAKILGKPQMAASSPLATTTGHQTSAPAVHSKPVAHPPAASTNPAQPLHTDNGESRDVGGSTHRGRGASRPRGRGGPRGRGRGRGGPPPGGVS
ncbi:hypothetical protein BZG36_04223 [Bifiguratus adelaidae]|uniref:UPF3 domain-containing protein n=1 Tax=Bifiguratus adelaidae TaxID=1938954 RepID=A0A261XYD2_9FUNG|nr:hypothetical protein BZG36_04223 [Bifiguratus adelaidae]